jgi:hypothetical protein
LFSRYYVKIFLDDDIYGKTTSKERREILFWGENFTFKDIPEGLRNFICSIFENKILFQVVQFFVVKFIEKWNEEKLNK